MSSLQVKLWGVRGSLPSPHPPEIIEARLKRAIEIFITRDSAVVEDPGDFISEMPPAFAGGYGGNTACVEVISEKCSLIIDGGSGLRRLSEHVMTGPCASGQGEVHILFTHFHWDHLMGLPFFAPFFVPGNKIHLYAVQPELEECVRGLFRKPYFPVPFEALRSDIRFHRLEPRSSVRLNGMSVTPYELDHPDPCWGYRIEAGGKAYAHCVDTECTRVSAADLGADLPLYQDADLVLFDAQYTLQEAIEKMNWGHSTAAIGVDLAIREGVKRILFAHHDPGASDEKIANAERQTREYVNMRMEHARKNGRPGLEMAWGFAREGQLIEL